MLFQEGSVTLSKHSHCSYCGSRYPTELPWPRTCAGCQQISYINPLPVAVVLLPVGAGLLCIRRAIEPCTGMLALPGGFIDTGETWQQAAVRELQEETGITITTDEVTLFDVHSAAERNILLIFAQARRFTLEELPEFAPITVEEVSEMLVIQEPQELAFPLHTQMARIFFESKNR